MAESRYVIVRRELISRATDILENSMFEFIDTGERAHSIAGELRQAEALRESSADAAALILSEDARIENGRIANIPYLAVKITSMPASPPHVSMEEIVEVLGRCLNYIGNTESELGIELECGTTARDLLSRLLERDESSLSEPQP